MPMLCSEKGTSSLLQKYHLKPQKRYGQNFLVDSSVLSGILSAAGVTKEDFVLEIGPGIGTLTQALCEAAREVTAVEIDEHMLPVLSETLSSYDNVQVLHADILKTDVAAVIGAHEGCRRAKVVANLPYYLTTPILLQLLKGHVPAESITVMVQEEVAARMQALSGQAAYSSLSLAVRYFADVRTAFCVPPQSFWPQPSVDSAVVCLFPRREPPVLVTDEEFLFTVIRAAFSKRRKTLVNALFGAGGIPLDKETLQAAVSAAGLPASVRGEELSLQQFAVLSDALRQRMISAGRPGEGCSTTYTK